MNLNILLLIVIYHITYDVLIIPLLLTEIFGGKQTPRPREVGKWCYKEADGPEKSGNLLYLSFLDTFYIKLTSLVTKYHGFVLTRAFS